MNEEKKAETRNRIREMIGSVTNAVGIDEEAVRKVVEESSELLMDMGLDPDKLMDPTLEEHLETLETAEEPMYLYTVKREEICNIFRKVGIDRARYILKKSPKNITPEMHAGAVKYFYDMAMEKYPQYSVFIAEWAYAAGVTILGLGIDTEEEGG